MTLTPCDLALRRDRGAGARVEVHQQEHLRAVRDRLLGLLLLRRLVALGVLDRPLRRRPRRRPPAANGRSTVSQRTEDFESGSRTATLPTSPPPLSPDSLLAPLPPLLLFVVVAACGDHDAHRERQRDEPDGSLLHVDSPSGNGLVDRMREGRVRRPPRRPPARARRAPRRARRASPATTVAGSAAAGSAARRTDSRTPSSSRSPGRGEVAADHEPLRVEHVADRPAAALPTTRPASAITRRQPRSPSRGQREHLGDGELAVAAAQQLEQRRGDAAVSRQPRLPQRQTAPLRSTRTWPSSPAMPARSRGRGGRRGSGPAPMPDETLM